MAVVTRRWLDWSDCVPRLDKAKRWTIVDMKRDGRTVFPAAGATR